MMEPLLKIFELVWVQAGVAGLFLLSGWFVAGLVYREMRVLQARLREEQKEHDRRVDTLMTEHREELARLHEHYDELHRETQERLLEVVSENSRVIGILVERDRAREGR